MHDVICFAHHIKIRNIQIGNVEIGNVQIGNIKLGLAEWIGPPRPPYLAHSSDAVNVRISS